MALNETEIMVISTKAMRFNEKESMAYLKSRGVNMDRSTYYRILSQLSAKTTERLYNIAKNLKVLHLDKLDELNYIKDEMHKNSHREHDPVKRNKILNDVAHLLPVISQYEEITQAIVEECIRIFGKEDINLSSLEIEDTRENKTTRPNRYWHI